MASTQLRHVLTAVALAASAVVVTPADAADSREARETCTENLRKLGVVFLRERSGAKTPPEYAGAAMFLDYAKRKLIATDTKTPLICPIDPETHANIARFVEFDPDEAERTMVSYAVRDLAKHPLDADAGTPQVVAVCPHHQGGLIWLDDRGTVSFRTREQLGIEEGAPIEVGKDARHPALAKVFMVYPPEQKDPGEEALDFCTENLRQLGMLWSVWRMETPGRPQYNGPALLLYFRQKHLIQRGQEEVLTCLLDGAAHFPRTPEDEARYDEFDLRKPPRSACSYAMRAFWEYPLRNESPELQVVACCPHHPEGALVLFEDTSVKLMSRKKLGLDENEEIRVGPESKSKLLRTMKLLE